WMAVPGALTAKRALLVLAPAVYIGGVAVLGSFAWPIVRLKYFAALSAVCLVVLFIIGQKEPWREVIAQMEAAAQPGDVALIEAGWMTIPFDYYDKGRMTRLPVAPADLTPTLGAQLHAYRRVWLVLAQEELSDPQ